MGDRIVDEESVNIKLAHYHLQEADKALDISHAINVELEQKLKERGKPSEELDLNYLSIP